MNKAPEQIEKIWNNLLSRQPELIKAEYNMLDTHSQKAVLDHLRCMLKEAGWQPEQRLSASAALQALDDQSMQEEQ